MALDKPALMVLDLMLPKVDGPEVYRRFRAGDHQVLILMLTARDEVIDKVLGLELGADDYVTNRYWEMVTGWNRSLPTWSTMPSVLHLQVLR